MALIDLANYDILDLLCIDFLPDEEKGGYITDYMESFSRYLADQVAEQFTDEDEKHLEVMLLNPATTPADVEKYYKEKIPNYDSFLLAGTLVFKKNFLLEYYRNMLEETTKANDPSVEYWIKIVAAAEEDNWEQTAVFIKTVTQKYFQNPQTLAPETV